MAPDTRRRPQKMSGEIREKTDFSLKRGAGIRYNIKNAFLRGGGSAVSKTMIRRVEPRSPAAKAGVQAGETLAEINGKQILDVLDYKFYTYDARLDAYPAGAGRQPAAPCGCARRRGRTWDWSSRPISWTGPAPAPTTASSALWTRCRRGCGRASISRMTTPGCPS